MGVTAAMTRQRSAINRLRKVFSSRRPDDAGMGGLSGQVESWGGSDTTARGSGVKDFMCTFIRQGGEYQGKSQSRGGIKAYPLLFPFCKFCKNSFLA